MINDCPLELMQLSMNEPSQRRTWRCCLHFLIATKVRLRAEKVASVSVVGRAGELIVSQL